MRLSDNKDVPNRRDDAPRHPPQIAKYGRAATTRAMLEAIAEQGGILPAPEAELSHKDVRPPMDEATWADILRHSRRKPR